MHRNGVLATCWKYIRHVVKPGTSRRGQVQSFTRRHRLETLESRWMLHGDEDFGINGPHESDPTYSLSSFHIHANLSLYINGRKTPIPTFGGVVAGDEIHTHDASGLIHIHPHAPRTTYVKLGEIFDKWKTAPQNANPNAVFNDGNLLNNFEDGTHTVYMFVNGVQTDAYQNYQIHDGDEIILAYSANPILTVNTNLGRIPVELFADKTPSTVNNFLHYVHDGDYTNSFFHRFVPGFVLQGGGYKTTTTSFADPSVVNNFTSISTDAPIQNEFDNFAKTTGTGATLTSGSAVIHLGSNVDLRSVVIGDRIRLIGRFDGINGSNMFDITAVNNAANTVTVRSAPTSSAANVTWTVFPRVNVMGTLAMAKLGGNPDSATSQFFINLVDNDANLDMQNGGFTTFGQILSQSFLTETAVLNDLSVFSASLTGAQEVPAVTTSATGWATLALNNANNQFDLKLNIQGLTAGNITASHIHTGEIGVEGASFLNLGSGAQYMQSGSQLQRTINNGVFPAAHRNSLVTSQTYINVQTAANQEGEIRGQLTAVQDGLYSNLPTTINDQLIVIESFSGDAVVQGRIFQDADSDGVRDQTEIGLSGFVVYSDENGNKRLDTAEHFATADSGGFYSLRLPLGPHEIRVVPTGGSTQTLPDDSYQVKLLIGSRLSDRDFGLSIWQNPRNIRDVNDDGRVAPMDALIIINELNDPQVSHPTTGKLGNRLVVGLPYFDVNGDGFVSSIDVLNIMNSLNAASAESESMINEEAASSQYEPMPLEWTRALDLHVFGQSLLDESSHSWENLLSLIARSR